MGRKVCCCCGTDSAAIPSNQLTFQTDFSYLHSALNHLCKVTLYYRWATLLWPPLNDPLNAVITITTTFELVISKMKCHLS
jgi:hypothetical protein